MDRYLTAKEIAEAAERHGIASMPKSKRGVARRASAEGWADVPGHSRMRSGSLGGGGLEYHVSLLPEPMQAALMSEVSRAVTVRSNAARRTHEIAKREALDTTALNARQREVMNARSHVLTAIEQQQTVRGQTRSQAVKAFLTDTAAFNVGDETLAVANDRSSKSITISRSTLLRWFKDRDDAGIAALAPKATRQASEIPAWFWDFLPHYARPQKPCITEALDAFKRDPGYDVSDEQVVADISYTKVRRLLGKLGNVERHRGREGSLTLKARMAYVTRSTADLLPTCVYTADGKTFDAEIAHPLHGRPFRPEITSVVDVATRRCVGFSVGLAENAVGVVDALRHACEQHGVPAIFYVDRGSGFKNHVLDARVTGLMGRLGITKYHSLPRNSQARGIIERFNGSVWNRLSREFDTYVGATMDMQARQKAFKVTRKDIKEFGTSKTLPSWEAFLEACNAAITAYNNRVHSSLPDRMTPNECWDWHVGQGFEPVTVTKAESDDLFRPYVRRKVSRCQIEFNTNKYFHAGLTEYDGDFVLIGYDIHDARHVWVREIDQLDGEEQPGALICVAEFGGNEERYVPLTMERKAMEGRARAATKRIEEKLDRVQAELKPSTLLDHRPEVPLPSFAKPDAVEADFVPVGEGTDVTEALAQNLAPRFATDAELARWAIANPDALHESQVAVLIDCVNDPHDRQLLVDHGVDLDALTRVLRSAA